MILISDVQAGDIGLTRFAATDATNGSILAVEIAAGGTLNGLTCGLFTNPAGITAGSVYADMVQPTFTGYATHVAVAFAAPILLPSGVYAAMAPQINFVCTATPAPAQLVYGWFLFLPAGTVLIGGASFRDRRGQPQAVVVSGVMTIPVVPAVGLARAA